jgi:iron complex outermembrane receptor protein
MGAYLKGKLKPKISFRYVMEQRRISQSFGGVESPGFFLMDIDLSYKITKAIRLTAGVYNLLNSSYYEFLNRPVRGTNHPIHAPGRSVLITLSVDFM